MPPAPLPIWPYTQPWKQLKNVHQQTALTAEPADQPAGDRQELKGWLRWAGLALASRHLAELGSLRDPATQGWLWLALASLRWHELDSLRVAG